MKEMTLNQLLTKKEEKTERWLIKDLIEQGDIAIMYGLHGHHKTGIALKIAMEVITGGKELGKSQNGKVLLYNLDSTITELKPRIVALMENRYKEYTEVIGSNLIIKSENYEDCDDFNLINKNYFYQVESDEDDIDLSWREAGFFDEDEGIKLIIIDTLSKAIVGSGINDDQAIRSAIHNLRDWIAGSQYRISILLIHHSSPKNPRKGMMGTSILENDLSTVLKIKKNKKGFELVREKHRSSHKGKSIPFKGREVLVDIDDQVCETIFVDIGSNLDQFNAEIVSQFTSGKSKSDIKRNTRVLGFGNNTTDKSFSVTFNRRWKKLIEQGFIYEEKQDNN